MPLFRRRSEMASEVKRPVDLEPPAMPESAQQPAFAAPVKLVAIPPGGSDAEDAEHSVDKGTAPSQPDGINGLNGRLSEDNAAVARDDLVDLQEGPPIQEQSPKHRRFSRLRFRNASDSQLSARARLQQAVAEKPPPLPHPPEIITTAPTFDLDAPQKQQPRLKLSTRGQKSTGGEEQQAVPAQEAGSMDPIKKERRKTLLARSFTRSRPSFAFDGPTDLPLAATSSQSSNLDSHASNGVMAPPGRPRMSESSRSSGRAGDQSNFDSVRSSKSTTGSSMFRLPHRRKKLPEPLFPIAHLQRPAAGGEASASRTSLNPAGTLGAMASSTSLAAHTGVREGGDQSRPATGNAAANQAAPLSARGLKAHGSPATTFFRPSSRHSGQTSPTRAALLLRERSSTMSSLGKNSPRPSVDEHPMPATTRTSTSTGRRSFGDLLSLSRLRQSSEPNSGRQGTLTPLTPGSSTSKNNSLQIARESITLPERMEDETAAKYLARIQEILSRNVIAAALSKGSDPFSRSVLRSYMRGFSFFGDPMDMSIRKLLMYAELPKETQQIDRFLQAFADRYHECNPGIYSSPDQAYFVAFSLLILHTDVFNPNNKHKMQRPDYLKNTGGEGIFDEILEVFYDNITYTPFIHVEDDFDLSPDRLSSQKNKRKTIFPNASPEALKKAAKEPLDPYALILEGKLDILRPNLKDAMEFEDHYSYTGTAKNLDLKELQKTFFRTGVLQIVSARSRPEAFMNPSTAANPDGANPGIVDIKITKVGLLWRKDSKKRRTRSPWQEWGAILTGAQLYFFRNTAWVRNLMHQYEQHTRQGHDNMPCIFKPPLEHFKPDALVPTDGAVALVDAEYKKHKNAFTYVRHGGFEEVYLADNEDERNDWLAKLNYAAAFRTSGVRMRGVIGGTYDGQSRRALRRLDPEEVENSAGETVTIARSRIDHKMAQDILLARRDFMLQKVTEANEALGRGEKLLETQLRNARHLQILAPVQPKTRDQMLLSAAKMAAQLKWTRVENWKVRCHRDILLLDLEEERQTQSLSAEKIPQRTSSVEEVTPRRHDESQSSDMGAPQVSPRSPTHSTSIRTSTVLAAATSDGGFESPLDDIFQTPPTSASAANFHKHQNSWELPPLPFERTSSLRKESMSSAVSSNSITATPPRNIATASSASASVSEKQPRSRQLFDVDAGERNLLEQAGLVLPEVTSQANSPESSRTSEATPRTRRERRVSASGATATPSGADRSKDRSKARRSLHRTLRESAGHLAHNRNSMHKKGKNSGSSAAVSDETLRDPGSSGGAAETLTRGTGSFLVHGKKASVINFGEGLQVLSPEERLRARKAMHASEERNAEVAIAAERDAKHEGGDVPSTTEAKQFDSGDGPGEVHVSTMVDVPTQQDGVDESRNPTRDRRESNATTSTATAMSFRDLHRKYSARTAAAAVGGVGAAATTANLMVPSDADDSDAALSFSDGRRSPLPPIGGEEEEEELEEHGNGKATRNGVRGRGHDEDDEDENEDEKRDDDVDNGSTENEDGDDEEEEEEEDGDDDEGASPQSSRHRQAEFFTPEPPGTPAAELELDHGTLKGKDKRREEQRPSSSRKDAEKRLPSPPVQLVSA